MRVYGQEGHSVSGIHKLKETLIKIYGNDIKI